MQQNNDYRDFYIRELFEEFTRDIESKRPQSTKYVSDLITEMKKRLKIDKEYNDEIFLNYYNAIYEPEKFTDKERYHHELKMVEIYPLIEKALGQKKVQEVKNIVFDSQCHDIQNFIIDLPDYDRQNKQQMSKDLSSIQAFWENHLNSRGSSQYNQQGNLIIFFQEELFYGHFFLGKFDVITLKPFTPSEMTEQFLSSFPVNPFEKEAILELASLSRGIKRRFKKYVRIVLDKPHGPQLINRQNINDWIAVDQIVKDMESELITVFPNEKEHRVLTVKLLRLLREKGGSAKQTDIVEEIFLDGDGEKARQNAEMKASRVLGKLESYGCITRFRVSEGKMVKLI